MGSELCFYVDGRELEVFASLLEPIGDKALRLALLKDFIHEDICWGLWADKSLLMPGIYFGLLNQMSESSSKTVKQAVHTLASRLE